MEMEVQPQAKKASEVKTPLTGHSRQNVRPRVVGARGPVAKRSVPKIREGRRRDWQEDSGDEDKQESTDTLQLNAFKNPDLWFYLGDTSFKKKARLD
jgi:hypothetical protein